MPLPEITQSRRLVVFTKPARPGRAKTRLIGALSAGQAAALHGAFLEDLIERMKSGPFELELAWELEAGDAVPGGTISGFRQSDGDLGDKLLAGLHRVQASAEFAAAVGSDHPDLPLDRVTEAFEALETGADLAIGPASDGGYYLIAASRSSLAPELFEDIPWSTDEVLASTLGRASQLGLNVALLAEGDDVDTPADLRRFVDRISAGSDCPRSRELLTAWGVMPQPDLGERHEDS